MRTESNPEGFIERIRREMGERLHRTATTLQTAAKAAVSTPAPPHSRPGEYIHAVTFTGRNSLVVVPDSPAECAETGLVRVGFLQIAWYMGYLEEEKQRMGLWAVYYEMKPELEAMLKGAA